MTHSAPPANGTHTSLSRLLRPRTLAVFGGASAAEVIRQNHKLGFAGEIWPVHPTKRQVEGHRAYCSVDELPGVPDAAFVGVNRHLTVEVVGALAERGAGGAVCYASGFAESGQEGAALQAALLKQAGTMPMLGPNCYGFVNYLDGLALWPDQHGGEPVSRGVALVTQSGNIGLNLTMQTRALPVGYLLTLGNQAAIGVSAVIDALVQDPRVTAIGLHIEGLDDPLAFARAAVAARSRGIPIVALATGRSAAGAQLTASHTASLSGAGDVMDAFLRRAGAVPVRSIPVMLETLKLLHLFGPLEGPDLVSMSCSGGEAALIADRVEGSKLHLRPFTEEHRAEIAATLHGLVTVTNPLDYHTFSWGDVPALTETFSTVMAGDFDINLLILDLPRPDRCQSREWDASAEAIASAALRTGARAAIISTLPELLPEPRAAALMARGVAPLLGLDDGLAAIEAALEAGRWSAPLQSETPLPRWDARRALTSLSEWDGKLLLASAGVTVPRGALARSPGEAAEAAVAIGFPVVLKAVRADLLHKTEAGAVRLDLHDRDAVRGAAEALLGLADTLLVEAMVTDAVAELIVGVHRDPTFGLCLTIGSGGILVELVGDSCLLLMPATRHEVAEALGSAARRGPVPRVSAAGQRATWTRRSRPCWPSRLSRCRARKPSRNSTSTL